MRGDQHGSTIVHSHHLVNDNELFGRLDSHKQVPLCFPPTRHLNVSAGGTLEGSQQHPNLYLNHATLGSMHKQQIRHICQHMQCNLMQLQNQRHSQAWRLQEKKTNANTVYHCISLFMYIYDILTALMMIHVSIF